jgi:serine/threonine-protein kinase
MVPGTQPYMSPEQIRGLALDLRTDIYSAGVVLYQVLTGRLPFQGANDDQLIRALLHDPVIPPGVLRTSCPPELDRALLRALCRDRRYRYASARELRDELEWVRVKYNLASGTQSFLQTSSQPPPRPVDVLAATRRASPPQGTPVVELGPAAQVRHTLPTIPDH